MVVTTGMQDLHPSTETKVRSKNSQPPPKQAPWLVFFHGKGGKTQTFYNALDKTCTSRNIPEMRQTKCLASNFGWLVLESKISDDIFLLHTMSLQRIPLPYSRLLRSFRRCILSSPPTDPDCVVMLYGSGFNSFIYWRPGANQWYERKYETGEMEESLHSIVSCNGKFYCEGSSGKVGVIDVTANSPVTWLETAFDVRPYSESMWRNYMVESCGDIFFIQLGFFPASRKITHFVIYKFDFERVSLTKVRTLGDRVLFLDDVGSSSCCASFYGMEKDCIYFQKTLFEDRSLYIFHLASGTISMHLPRRYLQPPWKPGFWVMPSSTDSL